VPAGDFLFDLGACRVLSSASPGCSLLPDGRCFAPASRQLPSLARCGVVSLWGSQGNRSITARSQARGGIAGRQSRRPSTAKGRPSGSREAPGDADSRRRHAPKKLQLVRAPLSLEMIIGLCPIWPYLYAERRCARLKTRFIHVCIFHL
jgi:hypothetical protein